MRANTFLSSAWLVLSICGCGDDGSVAGGSGGSGGSTDGGGGSGGGAASADGGGSAGSPEVGGGPEGGAGGGNTTVQIVNPGFEADPIPNGQFDDQVVPMGWSIYDPIGIMEAMRNTVGLLNPTGTVLYPEGAPEGSNVAFVFLWNKETTAVAGLSQVLSHAIVANAQYTLRLKVGNIAAEDAPVKYELDGFPGYRVELAAGGTVVASDDNTLSPAEGTFEQSTVTFTTGAADPFIGQPLEIRLLNLNGEAGIEVNFDELELEMAPAR